MVNRPMGINRATSLVQPPYGFLIAAVVCAAITFSCSGSNEADNAMSGVAVRVDTAQNTELVRTRIYTGTVEGIEQAAVFATIPDRIVRLDVSEGDWVHRGEVIIRFDRTGASSLYNQAKARYDDARKRLREDSVLFREKAISQRELDLSETAFAVAKADYESAAERTDVTAPITGKITDLRARAGRQASIGEELAVIARMDSVRIVSEIPVNEAAELAIGAGAVILHAGDSITQGVITEIAKSASKRTRTLNVEITAANAAQSLSPGMFVEVTIEIERLPAALAIPSRSLVYTETGVAVFVVENDVARLRNIDIGFESDALVQVTSGLSVGDTVVTLGHNMLDDGVAVSVKP